MIQSIIRDEINTQLRELLTAQKNEINSLIVQHLRQQQSITPKLQPTPPVPSSNPPPPPPPPTPPSIINEKQQTALTLARAGQLNQAFEYVLSASDLNLVVYLCENIRPTDLFSMQPCPLQIPVILSLIQQLAAELTTRQEVKYK